MIEAVGCIQSRVDSHPSSRKIGLEVTCPQNGIIPTDINGSYLALSYFSAPGCQPSNLILTTGYLTDGKCRDYGNHNFGKSECYGGNAVLYSCSDRLCRHCVR